MSNHLKNQNSPYLLQHAENPVDWFPWCAEAFEKAAREDKPVFLSVGYSTCHWCHVMAHESFENPKTAEILNTHFVSVKVDREERPDIDSVYMAFCQAFTGSGGWPMSIFMTAEQKPFYAGTYFPPQSRYGMPGFGELLLAIAESWKHKRNALLETADAVLAQLGAEDRPGEAAEDAGKDGRSKKSLAPEYVPAAGEDGRSPKSPTPGHVPAAGAEQIAWNLPERAAAQFAKSFDGKYGGFGSAPKFPTPHNLLFLTLYAKLSGNIEPLCEVKLTLSNMRRGGIFDHIGYGFSRYSTDRYYLVPHFEKMLYDNALLIMAYTAAYKACGEKTFLDTAEQVSEYIFREMTGKEGEFYSAQDADSEGEEGKYYVFRRDEICRVLGEEKGRRFCDYFGITEAGNFEGKNIPNLLNGNAFTDAFDEERRTLYDYRRNRGRLHLDDKILTAWNALMICAMSMLYRTTGKRRYLAAAERACRFIEHHLAEGATLYVSCRDNARSVRGFLDEYACYIAAQLFLYEAGAGERYLERAIELCREAEEQFADRRNGGYFLYGTRNDALILRPRETYDGALPSGNSVMAYCLVRLAQITEKEEYRTAAERQLAFLSREAEDYPAGHSLFLTAMLMYQNPRQKITVVCSGDEDEADILRRLPLYADVTLLSDGMEGYRLVNGKTTYYVCRDHTCLPPTNELE